MKKLLSRFLLILLFLPTITVFLNDKVEAAGTFYFLPDSGTKYNGQDFSVAVKANGLDGSDAIQAVFTYPEDKLTFVGINAGGSAWSIEAESSGGNGKVTLARGNISQVTGDKLIANVTFRPKVNSGTVLLEFTDPSVVTKAGENVTTGKTNATFTLGEAQVSNSPSDTVVPKISAVAIVDLTKTSAIVTWKTDETATSVVEWGPTSQLGVVNQGTDLITNHSVELDERLLLAGRTFYFRVKSLDAAGNSASSEISSFKLPGFEVQIKATDETGNAIVGAKVIIAGEEAVTDENGIATFNDLPSGKETADIEIAGKKESQTIKIEAKDQVQVFPVQVDAAAKEVNATLISQLAVVAVLIVLVALLMRYRKTIALKHKK